MINHLFIRNTSSEETKQNNLTLLKFIKSNHKALSSVGININVIGIRDKNIKNEKLKGALKRLGIRNLPSLLLDNGIVAGTDSICKTIKKLIAIPSNRLGVESEDYDEGEDNYRKFMKSSGMSKKALEKEKNGQGNKDDSGDEMGEESIDTNAFQKRLDKDRKKRAKRFGFGAGSEFIAGGGGASSGGASSGDGNHSGGSKNVIDDLDERADNIDDIEKSASKTQSGDSMDEIMFKAMWGNKA